MFKLYFAVAERDVFFFLFFVFFNKISLDHIEQCNIFMENHTILKHIDSKRPLSCCFQGHNLHHRMNDFERLYVIAFLLLNIVYSFNSKRIICTLK